MKLLQEYVIRQLSKRIGNIHCGAGYLCEAEDIDLAKVILDHPTLPEVLGKYGANTERLASLGSGDKGTAYSDGKLVIKLTSDIAEAYASHRIVGQQVPGVVQIYFVAAISQKRPEDELLYLIVQQRVDTNLTPTERELAEHIGYFLSSNRQWPFDLESTVRMVFQRIYMRTNQNLISPTNTEMVRQILQAVLNLYRYGVKYFDVGAGNVGKDGQGHYIIFDLGVSITKKTNLPVIEQLLDDREFILIP